MSGAQCVKEVPAHKHVHTMLSQITETGTDKVPKAKTVVSQNKSRKFMSHVSEFSTSVEQGDGILRYVPSATVDRTYRT